MYEKTMNSKMVEAVLFASDVPVEAKKLMEISDGLLDDSKLTEVIDHLNLEYEKTGRTFRIVEVAGGFQFETLQQYGQFIERLYRSKQRPKLTRASLETLAIVAYKQPISKVEIDALRGVDSDASIRTLQNRDLIEVTGRSDSPGKPMLYGTTMEFMRYFGLKDIKDLPGADELASMFDGTEMEESVPEQLAFDTDLTRPTQETARAGQLNGDE